MSTKPKPTLTKPTIGVAAIDFAEGAGKKDREEATKTARLNANIPIELHKALKVRAANESTTIGALIEDWIRSWKA